MTIFSHLLACANHSTTRRIGVRFLFLPPANMPTSEIDPVTNNLKNVAIRVIQMTKKEGASRRELKLLFLS